MGPLASVAFGVFVVFLFLPDGDSKNSATSACPQPWQAHLPWRLSVHRPQRRR